MKTRLDCMKNPAKTLIGICVAVAASAGAHAALLLEDHFSYPDGNLGAAGVGDAVWTSGDSPSTALRVSSAAALQYPGLAGATGSGVIYSGTTFKKRSAPFPAQSNGAVYVSFLLNIQTPPSSTKLFAWLHNAGGGTSSPGLGLFLNEYELGIAKYASSPTATTNIGPGTHLIVARYVFQPGNDRVDLWVDPPSLGDNENVPPPTLTTGTASSSDISTLSYIVLNHGISQVLWLDEVRVGTTWADVTPAETPPPLQQPPRMIRFSLGAHGLAVEGTNATPNTPFIVLAATNPALPLAQWRPIVTNVAGPAGEFAWTNPVDPALPHQFFRVFVGTGLPMAPVITAGPTDQTAPVGGSAAFSVTALGTPPLRYQWYFHSAALPGRTNSTLVLSNLGLADAGPYWVVVTNQHGSATSAVATLTVTSVPPAIVTQPVSRTVGLGEPVEFSVVATGTPPLHYQWYFNAEPVPGQTNAVFQLDAAQPEHAGNYHVVVANAAGAVTSAVAVLTVTGPTPPSIMAQPQSQSVAVGQTAVFSVTAAGTPPLRYQWYYGAPESGVELVGKTNATLVMSNVQTNDAGGYFVVVVNAYGAVTSAVAVLTVVPAPCGGIQQTVQAEDGTFTGTVDTEHAGWTGSGYVDTVNATGSYIEIEFGQRQPGTQMLYVRYAHGKTDDRTAELRVNGAVVNSALAFPPTGSWTTWQVVSNAIPVVAGRNVVRLTALTSAGLANIDCFQLTGEPQFKLTVNVQGRGTVALDPTNAFNYFDPGTMITLTALPHTNAEFAGWSGALSGTNNPATLLLDTNKAVTAHFDSVYPSTIYVAPDGNDSNPGTLEAPLYSLAVAVAAAQPGDIIYMRGGTYYYTATVVIDKAGTSNSPIRILAYPGERPVLNYSNWIPRNEDERAAARGIKLTTNAAWWVLKGLEICYAPDNGVKCEGSHIVFDQCVFHHNGDSGLQIGLNKDTFSTNPNPEHWAAYNLVTNCDSYRNADPATGYENADGFACKLYAGKGNMFYGCRAWENSDDGWDCYQTEHPIVIVNCWTWHNGDPSLWGLSSFAGDGNGFKLGGDNTYCPIYLTNCVALDHRWGTTVGFAYNNNTAPITLVNCAALNCGRPYKFEQNGNVFINCLDWNSTRPAPVDITGTSIQINNSWNLGITVTASDFLSVSAADAAAPREPDGSLPKNGFARPASGSQLIDRGTDVGLPFAGAAPDLGPYEFEP